MRWKFDAFIVSSNGGWCWRDGGGVWVDIAVVHVDTLVQGLSGGGGVHAQCWVRCHLGNKIKYFMFFSNSKTTSRADKSYSDDLNSGRQNLDSSEIWIYSWFVFERPNCRKRRIKVRFLHFWSHCEFKKKPKSRLFCPDFKYRTTWLIRYNGNLNGKHLNNRKIEIMNFYFFVIQMVPYSDTQYHVIEHLHSRPVFKC